MTEDFDQLIKEKIETKEYAYQHSYWKRFCKFAGFPSYSLSIWLCSAILASITGIGIALYFHHSNQNPTSTPTPISASTSTDSQLPTPLPSTNDSASTTPIDTITQLNTPIKPNKVKSAPQQQPIEKPSENNQKTKDTVVVKHHPKNNRILMIDVDTIKSNTP